MLLAAGCYTSWSAALCARLRASPLTPSAPFPCQTAALQLCVNLGCIYVIRRNWSWANSQPGGGQGPAVRTGSGDAGSTGLKGLPEGDASQKDATDVLPTAFGGTKPLN